MDNVNGGGGWRERPPPPAVPHCVVAQGAEAIVYRAKLFDGRADVAIKERFPKRYRLPELDARLTRTRLLQEARNIARCWRLRGVHVPAVYLVDLDTMRLVVEWIDGPSLRTWLSERCAALAALHDDMGADGNAREDAEEPEEECRSVLRQVGAAVATLHAADMVHGDLTTSNIVVRRRAHGNYRDDSGGEVVATENQVVLIDFGLSHQSTAPMSASEDKAVDLYVLERALLAAHAESADKMNAVILRAYEARLGEEVAASVLHRLAEVRQRGRKRSMVG